MTNLKAYSYVRVVGLGLNRPFSNVKGRNVILRFPSADCLTKNLFSPSEICFGAFLLDKHNGKDYILVLRLDSKD